MLITSTPLYLVIDYCTYSSSDQKKTSPERFRRGFKSKRLLSSFPQFPQNGTGQELAPNLCKFIQSGCQGFIGPDPSTFLDKSFEYLKCQNSKKPFSIWYRKGLSKVIKRTQQVSFRDDIHIIIKQGHIAMLIKISSLFVFTFFINLNKDSFYYVLCQVNN